MSQSSCLTQTFSSLHRFFCSYSTFIQATSGILHVSHLHPHLSYCHDVLDIILDKARGRNNAVTKKSFLPTMKFQAEITFDCFQAVPARVTLGVTSLLTLSTQHANSQKSLPPVSYIKVIIIRKIILRQSLIKGHHHYPSLPPVSYIKVNRLFFHGKLYLFLLSGN